MTDRDRAVPTLAECRPEVLSFARLMEAKLQQNEGKGGWTDCNPWYLFGLMNREVEELRSTIPTALRPVDPNALSLEAADVANFAMMIADVTGALDGLEVSDHA